MPTYVYETINDDGSPGEFFEVVQKMTDPPLETHPDTGRPVRRVIQPPNIAGQWTEGAAKRSLSDKNLDRLGFTRYERTDKSRFEKTAGSGPRKIGPDQPA